MIQFEELKLSLEELEPDIKDLKEASGTGSDEKGNRRVRGGSDVSGFLG